MLVHWCVENSWQQHSSNRFWKRGRGGQFARMNIWCFVFSFFFSMYVNSFSIWSACLYLFFLPHLFIIPSFLYSGQDVTCVLMTCKPLRPLSLPALKTVADSQRPVHLSYWTWTMRCGWKNIVSRTGQNWSATINSRLAYGLWSSSCFYSVFEYKEGKQSDAFNKKKKCGREIATGATVPLLMPREGTGGIEVEGSDSRCKDKIQKQKKLCYVAL